MMTSPGTVIAVRELIALAKFVIKAKFTAPGEIRGI
jgi:hypothetical protein